MSVGHTLILCYYNYSQNGTLTKSWAAKYRKTCVYFVVPQF